MAAAIATHRATPAPAWHPRLSVFGTTIALLLFYMIAFPKGGIKAGGVPLTIGYAFTPFLMLLAMARARGVSIPIDRLIALTPPLLLTLWSAISVYLNGAETAGALISYFVTVMYLPFFGMIAFSSLILDDHKHLIERTFIWAVRVIVVYGIFLFVFKQATGKWIEIPYVTVNAADVGQLDDKYIRRGTFFKLISTYNNGNIFGVCTIVMAPLYLLLEKRIILRGALYLALFLTLSRTAWIGIVLLFTVRSLTRGMRPATILYLLAGCVVGGLLLSVALTAIGADMSFLWDRNLGGRINQLEVLSDVRLIPYQPFESITEIAYLGMLQSFGIPGLLLFIAYLCVSPLLLWLEGVLPMSSSPAAACMQGMMLYTVMACSDAAFMFIPVMMVFWMIAGMGFWYAHQQAKLQGRARAIAC